MASHGLVLDIDAVDISDETTLMKAKQSNESKPLADLLILKLIYAVENKKEDIIKSVLDEFRNTPDIFVKSWSSNQDHDYRLMIEEKNDKFKIWRDVMYIAMENGSKHSEEILELLLDCDILLSQEIETGYSSFNQLMHGWQYDDKKLRLIELLLKSAKINVNDRDANGRTALHWVREGRKLSDREERETLLLIRYGADANRKDSKGRTPLMPISVMQRLYLEKFPIFQPLLEKAGIFMNLDAMDCNGQTALMHAVMSHRSNYVELLLNKGASVNLSDHLGFTALHHSLRGNSNEYFEFPRNSEELKKIKEVAILFYAEKPEHLVFRNEIWSEKSINIVEMLLQRPGIDVNALSFDNFSPLDIAEGQIPEIPSSIKDALKKKGAVLNVFQETKSQPKSDFRLDCAYMLVMKTLAYHFFANTDDILGSIKSRWRPLMEIFKDLLVSGKDQQGRTALHLMAISFYTESLPDCGSIIGFSKAIVDKLISLGCSVNETDIFGRTPLHYANKMLFKPFISKNADASIKDNDGNIATDTDKTSRGSSEASDLIKKVKDRKDNYLLRLMNNKQMEIHVQCVDDNNGGSDVDSVPGLSRQEMNHEATPTLLWEKGKYAFRHLLLTKITEEVTILMNATAKEIERLDPRFKIKPILVGSSNEGTKLDEPDEFDFCFVLTKISELCEVSQSPELPTGFVHLKRRPKEEDETNDFDSFFGKDEILNTEKLKWQFTTILSYALVNINNQLTFEWILELMIKHPRVSDIIKKVLNIQMKKPLNFFTVNRISVDIVPCIHIDNWWPDEAIPNVSDEIKKFGCNLVFDRPQELYPWVPYSESCARISFSKAESYTIKQSCDNAKDAYMIGKTIFNENLDVSKYVMKNCLLYCIEALSPSSEKASQLGLTLEQMASKFHQMNRYLWLKCLLKCHLEFVAQDFCPCYFLPTFCNCSIIEKQVEQYAYLKKVSFDWIADRTSEFPLSCKNVCALYRCASNDISESSYQLPAPDPLWERFDRKQLIASLCEIAYCTSNSKHS